MKLRRSILAGAGGVALGVALVTLGVVWSAGTSHAQTPSYTPTTAANLTPSASGTAATTPMTTETAVSTPTTATSPLTPVTTPSGGVSGTESLPGTGTGATAGGNGAATFLWVGIAVLAAGLGVSAVSLAARRRRS